MSYNEATIRDYLAESLDLIEAGLVLIEKEYHLPNSFGSKGFVDILAKDRNGLVVVIELKRSNGAARQCIHELFKYAGLLAQNDGIRIDQLRCIAISTEWHELLLPFSELHGTGNFQLEGYRLTVNKDGRPLSAEIVNPQTVQNGVELCPEYSIFLYKDNQGRHEDLQRIKQRLKKLGISDYLLAEINHVKNRVEIIYPFGTIFALPEISPSALHTMSEEVRDEFDEDCRYPVEMAVSVAVQDGLQFDDLEICYPDKFVNMTADRTWRMGNWHNSGKLKVSPLRTSQSLLSDLAAHDTGVATSFIRTLAPSNGLAWGRFVENVKLHLHWCAKWSDELFSFLGDSPQDSSSVSVKIYSPDDMLTVLYESFYGDNQLQYLPVMEVIRIDHGGISEMLVGYITWDGKTVTDNFDDFMRETFGSIENFITARHFGEQGEYEASVCKFFGLKYTVSIVNELGFGAESPINLQEFATKNRRVLTEMKNSIESFPVLRR